LRGVKASWQNKMDSGNFKSFSRISKGSGKKCLARGFWQFEKLFKRVLEASGITKRFLVASGIFESFSRISKGPDKTKWLLEASGNCKSFSRGF